jgi:nucleoid DNA-binding protein
LPTCRRHTTPGILNLRPSFSTKGRTSPFRDVEKAVNAIFGEIEAALVRRDRVELRGFGVFTAKTWLARLGRNPKTGAKISVPEDPSSFVQNKQRDAFSA